MKQKTNALLIIQLEIEHIDRAGSANKYRITEVAYGATMLNRNVRVYPERPVSEREII
jgi:hypothetical protein